MIILAIETSCDETAISIVKRVRAKNVKGEVLSHKILSQIDLHRQYGGVFPALAKREHTKAITQLIAEALDEAGLLVERTYNAPLSLTHRHKLEKLLDREPDMFKALTILFESINKPGIDAIAVTRGPGLEPALWVGINCALALNTVWDIPLYPVHHMEGHIIAGILNYEDGIYEIPELVSPAIALLISGGHTEMVRFSSLEKYKVIGSTRDDAAGEAFDKVARSLGLPYPGGPEISNLASKARNENIIVPENYRLPRPMIYSNDLDFSFSGLKTAVITLIKKVGELDDEKKKMIALEFENAVTDVLVAKVKKACFETSSQTIIVGGGVSANTHIRKALTEMAKTEDYEIFLPDKKLSTDNGIMIAFAGLLAMEQGRAPKAKIEAQGNWSLEEM